MNVEAPVRPLPQDPTGVARLCAELELVRDEILHAQREVEPLLAGIPADNHASALNLAHYVSFRRRDRRDLQGRLAALGLSSLGRSESHILGAVERVLGVLRAMQGEPATAPSSTGCPGDPAAGAARLQIRAEALLGPALADCATRVMVTMPTEAASDYALVRDLLREGMSCMRINCAHDSPEVWARMIDNLRRAEQATQRRCRVLMDLAGPKLRTGPLEAGPAVVKLRPERDAFGEVVVPGRVWLYAAEQPAPPPAPCSGRLGVPGAWLFEREPGDVLRLRDARGVRRRLRIVDVGRDGAWAAIRRAAYVVPGTPIELLTRQREGDHAPVHVMEVPGRERPIRLSRDDTLVLTADLAPGRDAVRDVRGAVLTPAHIGCTCPEIFADVRTGEEIQFDDGRIAGVIVAAEPQRLTIRIERTPIGGAKLRADKGINLPHSELRLPALTAKDLTDLEFVARYADLVAFSFANTPADITLLQRELAKFSDRQPAIVIKVETHRGFRNLPAMLMAALRSPQCGVMIARGDLAVECGFERLAEVQEEILWLCEAAHVPVIWATQVLESLAKSGLPSRAEITDAAMGNRAECVMLNKGPHIVEAVVALRGILRRMQDHQLKKRSMLRELGLARAGFKALLE